MSRARTSVVVMLMLSYGAVGARQPAVRTSVTLDCGWERLAVTLAIPNLMASRVYLDVVRIVFDSPGRPGRRRRRLSSLRDLFRGTSAADRRETVPLPLESVLSGATNPEATGRRQPADLADAHQTRRCSYHGLAALDGARRWRPWGLTARRWTACWLARAGAFATFSSSLRNPRKRVGYRAALARGRSRRGWSGPDRGVRRRWVRRLFAGDCGHLQHYSSTHLRTSICHTSSLRPATSCPTARGSSGCRRCSNMFDRTTGRSHGSNENGRFHAAAVRPGSHALDHRRHSGRRAGVAPPTATCVPHLPAATMD